MARAPDIVRSSLEVHGAAGRDLAALLGLAVERPDRITLALSQSDEHRALPERDRALRGADGLLPADLHARASSVISQAIAWDPARAVLRLDGYVADLATAIPRAEGPRYSVASPTVPAAQIASLGAWRPLVDALAQHPAQPWGAGDVRRIALTLERDWHALASLFRYSDRDRRGQQADRFLVSVAIGPWLPAFRGGGISE